MKATAIPAMEEAFKVDLDETASAGIAVEVGLIVEELLVSVEELSVEELSVEGLSMVELSVAGLIDVDVDESPGVVYFYRKHGQLLRCEKIYQVEILTMNASISRNGLGDPP